MGDALQCQSERYRLQFTPAGRVAGDALIDLFHRRLLPPAEEVERLSVGELCRVIAAQPEDELRFFYEFDAHTGVLWVGLYDGLPDAALIGVDDYDDHKEEEALLPFPPPSLPCGEDEDEDRRNRLEVRRIIAEQPLDAIELVCQYTAGRFHVTRLARPIAYRPFQFEFDPYAVLVVGVVRCDQLYTRATPAMLSRLAVAGGGFLHDAKSRHGVARALRDGLQGGATLLCAHTLPRARSAFCVRVDVERAVEPMLWIAGNGVVRLLPFASSRIPPHHVRPLGA
jgi:hypothetical protein